MREESSPFDQAVSSGRMRVRLSAKMPLCLQVASRT
jgi:hypothetical protein